MTSNEAIDLSSDDESVCKHLVTAPAMLMFGLSLMRYTDPRIERATQATNEERFLAMFGITAPTACTIYEDMQRTPIQEARIEGNQNSLKAFLMGCHYLRKYPTEADLEPKFDYSKYWARELCWGMIKRIRAMRAEKIVWPDDLAANDIWVISVDGTHSWTVEYSHPMLSQDPGKYSHKFHHAGQNYELGISLSTNQLVWLAGPIDAGASDLKVFRESGLLDRLEELGQKAIGDGGYNGEPKYLSTYNSHDSKSVRMFKSRALKRHENFNDLIKVFECTKTRFRHSKERFEQSFEAVCVLCQYKIENEVPLYDILVQAVIDADDESDEDDDFLFYDDVMDESDDEDDNESQ